MNDWAWYQWVMAVLIGIECIGAVILHGRERQPYDFVTSSISIAVTLVLLGAGGFWK